MFNIDLTKFKKYDKPGPRYTSYPTAPQFNEFGPGVWDIHSPQIPSVESLVHLLRKASARIEADRLWVNPDCGLKTRTSEEAFAKLKVMVEARDEVRQELKKTNEAHPARVR